MTSDIDAIQTFIVSGLLGILVNAVTLVGMIGVMFYINWRFTFIAMAVVPPLFFRRVYLHAAGKVGVARGEKKRRQDDLGG